MFIDIDKNPNCKTNGLFVFEELSSARPIQSVRLEEKGKEIDYDVTGVDKDGKFVQAYAQKISDSGAAFGFLIFGGAWGIRLKPKHSQEAWSLQSQNQKGEAYIVSAEEADIIYG